MARIIFHSRYFKAGSAERKAKLSYLIHYIGTREGVEKLNNDWWKNDKVTQSQEEMIQKLLQDVPELKDTHEYEDYTENPTKGNASEVISWATEYMANSGKVENYVDYIANRPRVEKIGTHGLFMQCDGEINLEQMAKQISEHPGNVWTNVISLRREDAERLGYNNADAWKTLVRAKAPELAKAMQIPYKDFKWVAAFHNESHHPHIHMVAYSTGQEGYLTEHGIEKIKSSLANEIFSQDLMQIFREQTIARDELKATATRYMDLLQKLPNEEENLQGLEPLIAEIKKNLPEHGKLQYAYMSANVKNLIDAVVDRLEQNPTINELYQLWHAQKCAAVATYTMKMPEKCPLKDNETFRSIKNMVLGMATEYEPTEIHPQPTPKPNSFHNFEERTYTTEEMQEMELRLAGLWREPKDVGGTSPKEEAEVSQFGTVPKDYEDLLEEIWNDGGEVEHENPEEPTEEPEPPEPPEEEEPLEGDGGDSPDELDDKIEEILSQIGTQKPQTVSNVPHSGMKGCLRNLLWQLGALFNEEAQSYRHVGLIDKKLWLEEQERKEAQGIK